MIASVSGTVLHIGRDHVVVEAGGVGYLLHVSAQTLDAVPPAGSAATLHTSLVVREDAMQLYGFSQIAERELFTLLTSISGVGPKVALAVLSGMSVPDVETALVAEDALRFQSVPGIGKRTAERIVVELKDKVVPSGTAVVTRSIVSNEPAAVAREGLLGLGYSPAEVDSMLSAASGESPEELIAAALRGSAA